jgi:hypothetical protein
MVTTLAQDVSALTAYLVRRNNTLQHCPVLDQIAPPNNTLATLLHRYPSLYRDINPGRQPVTEMEHLQQSAQTQFEIRLSRYMIEQMRRSQLPSRSNLSLAIADLPNPTLLSDFGLRMALQRFTGHVWGTESHKDLARRFLAQTQKNTFGAFKQNLYTYLIAAIPAAYRMQKFNQGLLKRLEGFMPENNDQPLNPFLLTATCRNLFKFFTVENAKNLNHHTLIDLVSNLNPFFVAELFLRLLLLCPQSRVHLDKRMALLFKHYSTRPQHEVSWLIQLLEYLNLAYSTNFGTVSLPSLTVAPSVA